MEAIPLGSWDITDDRILGPLRWNGFAECDGYQKSGSCTLLVDGGIDSASFIPSVRVLGDVLGERSVSLNMCMSNAFSTSSHHALTASRSLRWLSL